MIYTYTRTHTLTHTRTHTCLQVCMSNIVEFTNISIYIYIYIYIYTDLSWARVTVSRHGKKEGRNRPRALWLRIRVWNRQSSWWRYAHTHTRTHIHVNESCHMWTRRSWWRWAHTHIIQAAATHTRKHKIHTFTRQHVYLISFPLFVCLPPPPQALGVDTTKSTTFQVEYDMPKDLLCMPEKEAKINLAVFLLQGMQQAADIEKVIVASISVPVGSR